MLKCCLCRWSCMFGNDSRFGCMLDRFLDKFWYACLDTFGAIFDTKKNFQPFWLFLDRFVYACLNRFGQVLVCMFGHFWCIFWYQNKLSTILIIFWQICLCLFEQIWTGFGMHVLKHFCGHICLCIFGEIYDTKNCNYKWIYVDRFGYLLPNLSLTSLVHLVCPF
jgi:hypothetical protein